MSSAAQPDAPKRGRLHFRSSWADKPKLTKEAAKRQGSITQMAFLLLGGREAAIAFLNTDNGALDGRPLDVAIASDEGFANVEIAIRALAGA